MFSRFDRMPAYDRLTDRQTDKQTSDRRTGGQTDILPQNSPRYV